MKDAQLTEANINLDDAAVRKASQWLNENKSQGPDGIHPMVLKNCAATVALPLSLPYSKSLGTGKVPKDWKLANITPLFKK